MRRRPKESPREQMMEQVPEKTEKGAQQMVAIDGSRARSVREAKRLTQLYVANVVGVTTDTISRWENNRYPSIKRENAEKLARALEVDLTEILRQEEAREPLPQPSSPVRRSARLWPLSAVALLVLLFLAIYFFSERPLMTASAIRWTPTFAAPGEIIPVQIKVTRQQGGKYGFILKEKLPAGFRLISSLPVRSSTDATGSGIKWLIPGGSASVTVSYTMQVPPAGSLLKEARLNGEIVLRTRRATRIEEIGGNGRIRIGAYHWADTNGDGRIDDDEVMPAYYLCEDMKNMGLDWKTIEAIWSGKGYRWTPEHGYTVIK